MKSKRELIELLTSGMDEGDTKEVITQNIDIAYETGYTNAVVAAADIMWKHYRSLKDKEPYEYMAYQRYQEMIKLGEEDGTY